MFHTMTLPKHVDRIACLREPLQRDGQTPDVYLALLGRAECRSGFAHVIMARRYNIHVVEQGTMRIEIDGRRDRAGSGDAFMIFPGQHVRLWEEPGPRVRYTWLALEGERVEWAAAQAGLRRNAPVLKGHAGRLLHPILQRVEEEYANDTYDPLLPPAAAWNILHTLSSARPDADRPRTVGNTAVAARVLIDQGFPKGITINDVARALGVSRTTLFRSFREAFKASPKQYLDERRMEYACEFLLNTRMTASEIAHASGFQSPHYFSRVFRDRHGMPPQQWRKTGRTITGKQG